MNRCPPATLYTRCQVGAENYVIVRDEHPQSREVALQQVGRWAENKFLNFNWNHAAAMARAIKEES